MTNTPALDWEVDLFGTQSTPSTPSTGTIPLEEVWRQDTSLSWCSDCRGEDLTEDTVLEEVEALLGGQPAYLTHLQVETISQRLLQLLTICRFFQMGVEDSATRVHGAVATRYPLTVGVAIVYDVIARWNGCPEEMCEN